MPKPPLKSFEDIGLPHGHAFPELAYHHPTATIIASTSPRDSHLPFRRLSMRRVTDSRYVPIGDFPPEISLASFAMSPTLPLLYFITIAWSPVTLSINSNALGGDWDALYRFSLDTHQMQVIAQPPDLIESGQYKSARLAKLLSVSGDGKTLYCMAALKGDGADGYYLAGLSLADRRLTPITKLDAVFA